MNDVILTGTIPGFTRNTASIDGVRLHYLLGGSPNGSPVLLWHGFLSTSHAWRKVMPALANAGFAVLVPDMRGYGDSDKPAGTEGYDARALAEEFRALVREIGFGSGGPLTLVAHDMGAPVDPDKTVATLGRAGSLADTGESCLGKLRKRGRRNGIDGRTASVLGETLQQLGVSTRRRLKCVRAPLSVAGGNRYMRIVQTQIGTP
jgi:predicted alpha/beta hydrolase